jgi:hypothetical protein
VGDTKGDAVFAIATGDTKGRPSQARYNIPGLDGQVAGLVGGGSKQVKINDLAVNPLSGNIYLSVTGPKGPSIVKIAESGKLSQVSLEGLAFAKATLPNPPPDKVTERRGRKRNARDELITDLAYIDGRVLVSGRTASSAPSSVWALQFPFEKSDDGTNIEIYHGAHGRTENAAIVRTFVPFTINGEPNLLAGFTCTPLVKFPVPSLKPGKKTTGTTVAELGNRNTPLDMVVYEKGGKDYLLLTNDRRGVMKVSTEDIERQEGITKRIPGGGTAGQKMVKVEGFDDVIVRQMDKLNAKNAVVVVQSKDGGPLNLKTIEFP